MEYSTYLTLFTIPIQNTAKTAAMTAAVEKALASELAVSRRFTVPRLMT